MGGLSSPIVVAGTLCSGTSLVSSLLEEMGVDMEDSGSARGTLEADLAQGTFCELNRRALEECTAPGGLPLWGWPRSPTLEPGRRAELGSEGRALLESRARSRLWGWEDPRNALLLDFWRDALAGEGRFVLVYRSPWDVAEAIQRTGDVVFLENPDYAYSIWSFYNRELLAFYRRHADSSVLVSADGLIRNPERFVSLLRQKLGIELGDRDATDLVGDHGLSGLGGNDPLIDLLGVTSPELLRLFADLDEDADIASEPSWGVSRVGGVPKEQPAKLSVVIPCYNHGSFLIEAMASFERTTDDSCELVIVNDGSDEPRTLEILEKMRAIGYRIIDQENRGISAARNRGIEEAWGAYILPLDSDNRLRPGFAKAAVRVLDESPEVGVVYGSWEEFGLRKRIREPRTFDLVALVAGNFIDACAVFRKSLWAEVGGYDRELVAWADWEFWLALAKQGCQFHRLDQVCFEYRVRPNSNVSFMDDPRIRRQQIFYIAEKHEELVRDFMERRLGVHFTWLEWMEKRCKHQSAELRRKSDQLARKSDQLARKSEELARTRATLEQVRGTVIWGLARRYWSAHSRLFPAGSLRSRLYERTMTFLRRSWDSGDA